MVELLKLPSMVDAVNNSKLLMIWISLTCGFNGTVPQVAQHTATETMNLFSCYVADSIM